MDIWAASQNGNELPSLAAQNAFLKGGKQWLGRVRPAPRVDYEAGRRWFVVRTNPRCEDRALANLSAAGFDAFLPKGKRETVHARTKARIERPFTLMVGYVFAAVPVVLQNEHWPVLKACQGVRGVLGTDKGPLALPEREVELLRIAEVEDRLRVEREVRASAMRPGMQVRITSGPFALFDAVIVDAEVREAVSVLISLFNRQTQVTVPVDGLAIV